MDFVNYKYVAANIDEVIETVCKDNKPLLIKDDLYGDFVIISIKEYNKLLKSMATKINNTGDDR